MFESAEIGHSIDKETFEAEVPALREASPLKAELLEGIDLAAVRRHPRREYLRAG